MSYTLDDLQAIEPLDFVRSHPGKFFHEVRAEELAGWIVREALILTHGPVAVLRRGHWWIIEADADWLTIKAGVSLDNLFHRVVPFPEAGANSMRSEILLTAFASDVWTGTRSERQRVKDSGEGSESLCLDDLPQSETSERFVAFRLDGKP